jgi:hypothetical protein
MVIQNLNFVEKIRCILVLRLWGAAAAGADVLGEEEIGRMGRMGPIQ